jgi:cytochrome c oxidase subunit IV
MSEHHADSHGTHSHTPYWLVFAALCCFTAISWIVDEMKKGGMFNSYVLLIVVVLAVASAKALAVMMFFMHLKFEGNWKYVLLAPTIILAIGLPLALLPDIGVPYYMRDVPQSREVLHESSPTAPVTGSQAH